MKTVELSQTASPAPRAHLPEALPVGESNPALHRELSVLAGEVIKDALSLIHLPNLPDTYVEERLKRRAAMVLALLYTSEPTGIENFTEYAEEMLTMAVFSEIMELQA